MPLAQIHPQPTLPALRHNPRYLPSRRGAHARPACQPPTNPIHSQSGTHLARTPQLGGNGPTHIAPRKRPPQTHGQPHTIHPKSNPQWSFRWAGFLGGLPCALFCRFVRACACVGWGLVGSLGKVRSSCQALWVLAAAFFVRAAAVFFTTAFLVLVSSCFFPSRGSAPVPVSQL